MDFRFSATATTVTADMIKTDQPLSTEAAAAAARAINAIRDAPPSRVAPPVALRGLIGELVAAFALGNKLLNIDPEFVELLAGAQKAQLDAPEPQLLNETVRQTRAMCASFPFEEFWQRYPNAKNRWAAKGALGALIGNTQSGWTSTDFSSLAAADFALVERAIAERQADGLVALLSSSNASSLRLLELDASQSTYVPGLGMSAGRQVADIALCQLGIADCSSQSPAFKDACATYGGCHQPDLAALMRYVLARDDMDPTLFDRNADRVTGAIYANNLEVLGIRRTRDEK